MTDTVRKQAIHILDVKACSRWESFLETAKGLGYTEAAAGLALEAYCDVADCGAAGYAEAAQLLRDGWNPTKKDA